jgi:hypothetical protein
MQIPLIRQAQRCNIAEIIHLSQSAARPKLIASGLRHGRLRTEFPIFPFLSSNPIQMYLTHGLSILASPSPLSHPSRNVHHTIAIINTQNGYTFFWFIWDLRVNPGRLLIANFPNRAAQKVNCRHDHPQGEWGWATGMESFGAIC